VAKETIPKLATFCAKLPKYLRTIEFSSIILQKGLLNLSKETIMEAELWKQVYELVTKIGKCKTIKRATYSDAEIILTYMWAVLHDRPIYWACKKGSWPIYYRSRPLPNPSTMTRRLRKPPLQRLLREIEKGLVNRFPRSTCRWIDGKPLPIGGSSKDKQSAFGFGGSSVCKGYKLYAVGDLKQGFVEWTIRSMNHNESKVATELIPQLDHGGYLVGDAAYDSNKLYEAASKRSIQLVAPKRSGKELGHRRHSPHRIRSAELLERPFGRSLLIGRRTIERMFGNLVSFSGGLKPLPHWVRTSFRVEMWVRGKMILYHLWRTRNERVNSA
jgi:hypothetical protein